MTYALGTALSAEVANYDVDATYAEPRGVVAPPDLTAPTVTNFSPAPGSGISYDAAISFDVQDETDLRAVLVFVTYPDGSSEVVWDGDGFTSPFVVNSTAIAATNSLAFTVARYGGWEKAPTIKVFAVDAGGNLAI